MIFRELLTRCDMDKVVYCVKQMMDNDHISQKKLKKQYGKRIQELLAIKDYCVLEDTSFCFVVTEKADGRIYVGLYDTTGLYDLYGAQRDALCNATDYAWLPESCLGIHVFEESIQKYGIDLIVAGVLHAMEEWS